MTASALTLLNRLTSRARLRHMQAMVVLDDLRSMSRAAQAMGMTQPAMTQLVAELESLIETQLYLRHSRGVDPTPAAIELLPVARRILTATEEAAERIASRQHRDGGLVRVAATVAGSGSLLHRVLPGFARAHPHIRTLIEGVVGQALDASFAGDEFDLMICRAREVVPEGWEFVRCLEDALVVVAGPGHPLARKARVDAADLAQASWLQNQPATIARHGFDAMVTRQGWDRLREVPVMSRVPSLIWSMLREGTLLTMTPQAVVQAWVDDGHLVILPTDLAQPLNPVGFYWRPAQAGSASRLLAQALSATRPGVGAGVRAGTTGTA
jgi:DNA-binding transcriptional LysR family regulator